MGQYPEHLREIIAEDMGVDLYDNDDIMLTEDDIIIDEFIKKSRMFGFDIKYDNGKFTSTTKCSRCGREFTIVIDINVIDIHDNREVQCTLPIYCNRCKEGISNAR